MAANAKGLISECLLKLETKIHRLRPKGGETTRRAALLPTITSIQHAGWVMGVSHSFINTKRGKLASAGLEHVDVELIVVLNLQKSSKVITGQVEQHT